MTRANSRNGHKNARRGLATVAFLKARFDRGLDHLDMLQPFVEDSLRRLDKEQVELTDVQAAVTDLTGVLLPAEVVKTLLQRAAKKGLVTRAGGKYLRRSTCDKIPDLTAVMADFDSAHRTLAESLLHYASSRNDPFQSTDDALIALNRFLDRHHIGIILGQSLENGTARQTTRHNNTIAAFIARVFRDQGPDLPVLDRIVKGLIVQNALLMRDVPAVGRQLDRLKVYLDSGVLLRALGYAGSIEQRSTKEALRVVRVAGARLYAFERTVHEMENVLRVYENKLGTPEGIRSLRGTPLTHHFLRCKATPADVRQEIVLVQRNLAQLNITVREFPEYINRYTEDEQTLADSLRNPSVHHEGDDNRIWHDVRVVSAVMTLRAGGRPARFADAKHVFASGSARTVASITRWYRDSYSAGLEPAVHIRSVTNAAWLIRPAYESSLPMHELVSVCAAVLRPAQDIWQRFVKRLDEMVASGELSDDESIAIVASDLAQNRLAELEPEDDVEATTVLEIVDRTREEAKEEATAAYRDEIQETRQRQELSDRVADDAREELAAARLAARNRAEKIARYGAMCVFGVLGVGLVVGAIWTLPIEWSQATRSHKIWNSVWWTCVGAFYVASLLGFFSRRFHVLNTYERLKMLLFRYLYRLFWPNDEGSLGNTHGSSGSTKAGH